MFRFHLLLVAADAMEPVFSFQSDSYNLRLSGWGHTHEETASIDSVNRARNRPPRTGAECEVTGVHVQERIYRRTVARQVGAERTRASLSEVSASRRQVTQHRAACRNTRHRRGRLRLLRQRQKAQGDRRRQFNGRGPGLRRMPLDPSNQFRLIARRQVSSEPGSKKNGHNATTLCPFLCSFVRAFDRYSRPAPRAHLYLAPSTSTGNSVE
jgi:predicted Zn-dependent protease